MKNWLLKCSYPENVIDKGFYNAKLQGPAPNHKNKKEIMPFVTTSYNNYSNKNIVRSINSTFQNSNNHLIKTVFGNYEVLLSQKQTQNLLCIPTKEEKIIKPIGNGLFRCQIKDVNFATCTYKNAKNFNYLTESHGKLTIELHVIAST